MSLDQVEVDRAEAEFRTLDDEIFAQAYAGRNGMRPAEIVAIEKVASERRLAPLELGPPTPGDHEDEQRRRAAYPAVEAELAIPEQLPDVLTGELLPVNRQNAARVIVAARTMRARVQDVISAATAFLAEESRREGTKTLHVEGGTVVLKGGPRIDYDAELLRERLAAAECPDARIEAAIETVITYKVNRSVLRQLAGANEAYAAAIKDAEIPGYENMSASVKL